MPMKSNKCLPICVHIKRQQQQQRKQQEISIIYIGMHSIMSVSIANYQAICHVTVIPITPPPPVPNQQVLHIIHAHRLNAPFSWITDFIAVYCFIFISERKKERIKNKCAYGWENACANIQLPLNDIF